MGVHGRLLKTLSRGPGFGTTNVTSDEEEHEGRRRTEKEDRAHLLQVNDSLDEIMVVSKSGNCAEDLSPYEQQEVPVTDFLAYLTLDDRALLDSLDEDKTKRKLVMRKSMSSGSLNVQSLTQYMHKRLSDLGWDWSEADPIMHKQNVSQSGDAGDKKLEAGKWEMRTDLKAVAVLTSDVLLMTIMVDLLGLLSEDAYQSLRKSAYRCIARAVLSIFDMEDFERIKDFEKFLHDYEKFSSGLDTKQSSAEQNVELGNHYILREHDAFCALKSFCSFKGEKGEQDWKKEGIWNYHHYLSISGPSHSDIETAWMAIQRYEPLKRNDRRQLILEMMFNKQYLVYGALVLGTLGGITNDLSCDEDKVRLSSEEQRTYELEINVAFSHFVTGIREGLYRLMRMKSSSLNYFQEALLFPIRHSDCFGPCDPEVCEIIKFADFERRMQNERSVTSEDILFCLSLSRVGSSVKSLLVKGMPSFPGFSLFSLYKRAREQTGSGESMTLDHLVMAFFPGKHEVKNNTSRTDGTVLYQSAWDNDLWKRLGLTGYEVADVVAWNSFKKYSEDLSGYCNMFDYAFSHLPLTRRF